METTVQALWKRAMLAVGVFMLACVLALGLSACSSTSEEASDASEDATEESVEAAEETPTSVTIQSYNGSGELVDLEVPYNPERIAVLDMASLDILDAIGVGDNVVGIASTSIEYLQSYAEDSSLAALGTIKEADLEAIMACEPDVIFIGGRLSSYYDELSEIAPVVYLATDSDIGVVESTRNNATTIASMFGLEDTVDELMSAFDERIAALQEIAEGHTALVTMFTSGSANVLGNDGRCSIIGVEIGFENLAEGDVTSTHGNEISFETIVALDPEYIFVMNRDAAIGSDGADQAQEVIENELTQETTAYQNGNIIYLEHPTVWYTAEGGITALDYMLQDLESALL